MLNTIRSHKFQESISYYTEDIDWSESRGMYAAPGIGDMTGREYDVLLEECGTTYSVRDIRIHNT